VNVRGTFNVLEACRRNRIQRLVYSSSASVYGDALEEPMTESHPFNCWTFYGATKIAGEAMLKAYHKRYGLAGVGIALHERLRPAPGLSRRLHRGHDEGAGRHRSQRGPGGFRGRFAGL
jgi:nucleoside-diphosphate-sugar epimerase